MSLGRESQSDVAAVDGGTGLVGIRWRSVLAVGRGGGRAFLTAAVE